VNGRQGLLANLRRHDPLVFAVLALWLTVAVLLALALQRSQGRLVYVLDDTYIHMAMAKNLAQHGVWGVTRYEFSSSSSSPLWTLLLAFTYTLFGVNEASPFILSLLLATVTVVAVYALLRSAHPSLPPSYVLLILLALIFLTSLPSLVFTGLEHILHALLTIVFVYLAAKALSQEAEDARPATLRLWLVAPFLTATRYEGLFLLLVACALFVLRGRWRAALALGVLGALPLGVYGLISAGKGWFFLPNSVLLKSDLGAGTATVRFLGIVGGRQVVFAALAALPLALYAIRFQRGLWERHQVTLALAGVTFLLHLQFARTGWFYRYEAYLIALTVSVAAPILYVLAVPERRRRAQRRQLPLRHVAMLLFALALLSFLTLRSVLAVGQVPGAVANIYEQQLQMSLFLRAFYQGVPVAANDIGAISFYADIKTLDLMGLANLQVAQQRLGGAFGAAEIDGVTARYDTRIAIVYDTWFQRDGQSILPPQWIKVGEWRISAMVVAGGHTVSFYAVAPVEEDRLIANLRHFAPQLPATVRQSGKYME
jgi:hypothetical protein